MGSVGKSYGMAIRSTAAKAISVAQTDAPEGSTDLQIMTRAVSWLIEQHPQLSRRAARRLIHRFTERFAETGSVEDAKRSGRPRKATTQHTAEAKEVIRRGYTAEDGRQLYYRSMAHAVQEELKLRSLMQETAIRSPRTLQRAVQKDYPQIKRRRLRTHKALTDEQKAARIECATDVQEIFSTVRNAKQRVIWIDSKVYTVEAVGSDYYLVDTSEPYIAVETDQPLTRKQQKINAYIAVSWFGPVGLYVVTGSSWLPPGHPTYKVSLLKQTANVAPTHPVHKNFSLHNPQAQIQ